MLKKLGLTTLGLAGALTLLAPTVTLARDRDDFRGRGYETRERHEMFERREHAREELRGHDRQFRFGIGVYTAPPPAANGYYDDFGNWHPYGYYDHYGYWHQ